MTESEYKVVTVAECPDIRPEMSRLVVEAWPEFMMHDLTCERNMHLVDERYPEYQFALLNDRDEAVAAGNSIPLPFDSPFDELSDTGIDWMLTTLAENENYPHINQFAIQVVIRRDCLGQGLSAKAVAAMANIGRSFGCRNLFAPVRPNRKCDYPLTPMERYIRWTRDDTLPFDPWMRVHARLGAEVVKVCPQSMYIPGTVAEWESWIGLKLPESGSYVFPGGLVPLTVSREKDLAEYIEPNVWMRHPLA